jgi:hypothetical protein
MTNEPVSYIVVAIQISDKMKKNQRINFILPGKNKPKLGCDNETDRLCYKNVVPLLTFWRLCKHENMCYHDILIKGIFTR